MRAQEKVYKAFYESKKDRMYFNELKHLTKLSNSSLQNAIRLFIKDKILEKQATKANTFYTIKNKKIVVIEYAKIAVHRFETLNRNVRIPLKDFIKKVPREVVSINLFGSSARNSETEKSDIDLLIILHHFENEVIQEEYEKNTIKRIEEITKDIQTRSIHHISLAFTNSKEFRNGKDYLVNQAKETGFPIINEQTYFEVLNNEY